jgi:ABC-2 type transport system permease protein
MQVGHSIQALRAVTRREIIKFLQQRGRLLSALVRPLMWLAVFAAGFYNVFGVSIIPPYKSYVTYQVYIVPGLLGIILLFHGMQSSLSMVYDREMGMMRLLLTAPLPRWVLLGCKLAAGTALSVMTCYAFLLVCTLFDVTFDASGWLAVLPALVLAGLMLGALWLFLSVYISSSPPPSTRCGGCARAGPSFFIWWRSPTPSPTPSSSSAMRSTDCWSRFPRWLCWARPPHSSCWR